MFLIQHICMVLEKKINIVNIDEEPCICVLTIPGKSSLIFPTLSQSTCSFVPAQADLF